MGSRRCAIAKWLRAEKGLPDAKVGIGTNWYTASEDTQRSPDTQAFTALQALCGFHSNAQKRKDKHVERGRSAFSRA